MDKGERLVQAAVLAALYCKGAPHAVGHGETSRWPKVWDAVRHEAPCLGEVADVLRRRGLWAEAAAVDASGSLHSAVADVVAGRVLTVGCPAYPRRWADRLGSGAPPALWAHGAVPNGPLVGVAGSRCPSTAAEAWLTGLCAALAGHGLSVVSGGASGVDRLAVSHVARLGGAGRAMEVLPCGLSRHCGPAGVACLSPWALDAPFSVGQAMARNTLLYAASPCTVVIQPRLRAGGTWAGAVDALRRRLCKVVVWGPGGCAASEALVALGAVRAPHSTAEAAQLVLGAVVGLEAPCHLGLFGNGVVREGLAVKVA